MQTADDTQEMLTDCERREPQLTHWERAFINDMQTRYELNGRLSPPQYNTLTEIWERVTS